MGNMPLKLYVGSLHFNITEDDLKKVPCPALTAGPTLFGVAICRTVLRSNVGRIGEAEAVALS